MVNWLGFWAWVLGGGNHEMDESYERGAGVVGWGCGLGLWAWVVGLRCDAALVVFLGGVFGMGSAWCWG